MRIFDEGRLALELEGLPPMHRAAFAASCCERMLPNYLAFSLMTGWGRPDVLRHALDCVWEHLRGAVPVGPWMNDLFEEIKTLRPDLDNFTTIFKGAGLDAVAGIMHTIRCCQGDYWRAVKAANNSFNSIYQYIGIVDKPLPLDPGDRLGFAAFLAKDTNAAKDTNHLIANDLRRQAEFREWIWGHPLILQR